MYAIRLCYTIINQKTTNMDTHAFNFVYIKDGKVDKRPMSEYDPNGEVPWGVEVSGIALKLKEDCETWVVANATEIGHLPTYGECVLLSYYYNELNVALDMARRSGLEADLLDRDHGYWTAEEYPHEGDYFYLTKIGNAKTKRSVAHRGLRKFYRIIL